MPNLHDRYQDRNLTLISTIPFRCTHRLFQSNTFAAKTTRRDGVNPSLPVKSVYDGLREVFSGKHAAIQDCAKSSRYEALHDIQYCARCKLCQRSSTAAQTLFVRRIICYVNYLLTEYAQTHSLPSAALAPGSMSAKPTTSSPTVLSPMCLPILSAATPLAIGVFRQ